MDPPPLPLPLQILKPLRYAEISHLDRKPTARKNFDIRSLNELWEAYTIPPILNVFSV